MGRYFLSKKAKMDIEEIWEYTFREWSKTQAEKYYRLLIEEFQYISENSQLGLDYTHIIPDLKAKIFKRHLIFYREIGNKNIEIIRILHQSMDYKSRL